MEQKLIELQMFIPFKYFNKVYQIVLSIYKIMNQLTNNIIVIK